MERGNRKIEFSISRRNIKIINKLERLCHIEGRE
jgi:hypothetical protein